MKKNMFGTKKKTGQTFRSFQRGFTIVEMLTASVILVIAFVALLTLLRAGRSLDIEGLHRRRARAIIDSCFESSTLKYQKYAALTTGTITGNSLIDNQQNLVGSISISVGEESPQMDVAGTTTVTYRPVVITVSWNESGETKQISIEKWISSF